MSFPERTWKVFMKKHVLHSLSIAAAFELPAGCSVMDLGTGGGFPGIPLAIFFIPNDFSNLHESQVSGSQRQNCSFLLFHAIPLSGILSGHINNKLLLEELFGENIMYFHHSWARSTFLDLLVQVSAF